MSSWSQQVHKPLWGIRTILAAIKKVTRNGGCGPDIPRMWALKFSAGIVKTALDTLHHMDGAEYQKTLKLSPFGAEEYSEF